MSGMRLLNESTYYWVWSAHGPADDGCNYGRTFVNGMIPCPVPGDVAQNMESYGYEIAEYEPGTWFSDWVADEGSFRQHPVFMPIETGQFPPSDLPDKLPDSWVDFFGKYTASGKLKKEHRGL